MSTIRRKASAATSTTTRGRRPRTQQPAPSSQAIPTELPPARSTSRGPTEGLPPNSPKDFIALNACRDLITHPTLQASGLAINTELSLFVCSSCQSAFTMDNVINHLSTAHKLKMKKDVRVPILELGVRANIKKTYPMIESTKEGTLQYSGLALKGDLSGCPDCGYTAALTKVQAHIRENPEHTGQLLTNMYAQVLNTGATKTNIRVIPRPVEKKTPAGPCAELLEQIHNFDWRGYQKKEVPNARMISPFLMRTRWHEDMLPYQDRLPEIRELASMPKKTEFPGLHELIKAYLQKATALLDATDELVLQRLNSADPDKDGINNIPLHAHHQDKTLTAYAVPVTHLVAALLRPSEHYQFPTSPQLQKALGKLLDELNNGVQDEKSLHSVLKALWKTTWETTKEKHRPDPTMCFLMLFCIKTTGEFFAPKDVTGPIAKLCRGIQLTMVTEIHALVDKGVCENQMEAMDNVAEYVTEKQKTTTFNSLMTLQHFTSKLAYQTLALPRIWWLDRDEWSEMLYDGNVIGLGQVEEVFRRLEAEIVDLWENKVMMGLGLRVDYEELADDLRNTEPGYCFLDDPKNVFAAHENDLIDRVFNDPELLEEFTTLMTGSDVRQLNMTRCREWLGFLAKLEGLLMLYSDMAGGAPPRGTELVSMLMRNTIFRTRNLRGLGKYVALIRQYDKTSNITQTDQLIPHAVNALCADLLVQVHALARPLARYLSSVVFPQEPQVVAQYGEILFMDCGKEFTSDKLADLMGTRTKEVLGWPLKIWGWRHVNIAWRQKLCGGSVELFEANEATRMVQAAQAGHRPDLERRVYGLSPDALMGTPEDRLYLFLGASTDWQRKMGVVPGGLALPYYKATMQCYEQLEAQGLIKSKKKWVTPGAIATATAPTLQDPSINKLFTEFQAKRAVAETQLLQKQDATMAAIDALKAEVRLLRAEIQRRPVVEEVPGL
ncbi:hypothetical protein B0H11DRAFT_2046928 [Mycena galericulata]|nr:hypothetical protein B0H11DRAFT_2046928 [Mycena galericulata]